MCNFFIIFFERQTYARNPVRRLRLRSDSKGGGGCPSDSPDGLWIGKSRVPWIQYHLHPPSKALLRKLAETFFFHFCQARIKNCTFKITMMVFLLFFFIILTPLDFHYKLFPCTFATERP